MVYEMEVNDIRPDNLMKESKRLRLKDLEDLLKNESRFIKVPCPACQLNDYSFLFRKEGFNFVGCNKCETIFINPRPTFDIFILNSKSETVRPAHRPEQSRRTNSKTESPMFKTNDIPE